MESSGSFSIQLHQLNLSAVDADPMPPTLRVDLEWINTSNLTWNSGGASFSSPALVASRGSSADGAVHSVDFGGLSRRTIFFELSKSSLSQVCNASLRLTVCSITVPLAPTTQQKGGKGAPAEHVGPVTEPICELILPLSSVLLSTGCALSSASCTEQWKPLRPGVVDLDLRRGGVLVWSLRGDNDLAEYALGSALFRFAGASLTALPPAWALPVSDAPEPKTKGPPTDAAKVAQRLKYIESAGKAAAAARDLYVLEVARGGDVGGGVAYLGFHVLDCSRAAFDAAALLPAEDVGERADLWGVSWEASPAVFLHRGELKRVAFALFGGALLLPVTLRRKALPASPATAGAGAVSEAVELEAHGVVDLKEFASGGLLEVTLTVPLSGRDGGAAGMLSLRAQFSSSPAPPSTRLLPPLPSPSTAQRVVDVASLRQAGAGGAQGAEDSLEALRAEIARVVRAVAREYVALYPLAAPQTLPQSQPQSQGGDAEEGASLGARKADFLHYLSSTAGYHALKESLKPRIQQVVKSRYGARGRALGAGGCEGGGGSTVPAEGWAASAEVPLDALLQETYTFLLRECNGVLNALFASTRIERDAAELEGGAASGHRLAVDDEEETPAQAWARLGDLSADAEADGRHSAAEQWLLERLQLAASASAIGLDADKVYASYALYAEFLLRRSAKLQVLRADPMARIESEGFRAAAREALEVAVSTSGRRRYWRYELLLGCVLYEGGEDEAGDAAMDRALGSQLGAEAFSVDDLGGYDSDGLTRCDPLLYAVLAGHFHGAAEGALRTRKALRLMSSSYAALGFLPPVETHGAPRRTAALCLARAAEYLFGFGFLALGGSCLRLAKECDAAAAEKAVEFDLPAASPLLIRYGLRRAEAADLLSGGRVDEAVVAMRESALMTNEQDEKIRSLLWAGNAAFDFPQDDQAAAGATDAYMQTLALAPTKLYLVPLDAFVRLAKLLLAAARLDEAQELLLFGCRLYAFSSTLFRLVAQVSLRAGRLQDAEDALYEANLLDNRNAEVWGYSSLLCLTVGPHRQGEADASLQQALRLGLESEALLRELAVAYMAGDRLQVAEELLRRAAALEMKSAGRVSPSTRKLLADVLAAQSSLAEAIDEYRAVLEDPAAGTRTKLDAATKSLGLLTLAGRTEEADELTRIVAALREGGNGTVGAEI